MNLPRRGFRYCIFFAVENAKVNHASARAMRLKVFRAQIAMALSALEKEAARGSADGRIEHAVNDLKSGLAHIDLELATGDPNHCSGGKIRLL